VSSAMLITHNPGIQDLALALAAGGSAPAGLREKFPTGALATVGVRPPTLAPPRPWTATATGLVTPQSLESRPGAWRRLDSPA
jgi:phosphohistidine phosphatase